MMKYESRFGLNYDDPKFIRRVIDAGNARVEADSPEKMLFFAMIEECVLTATAQKNDWKKPCTQPGCGGRHNNRKCAELYLASRQFGELCIMLGIEPDYFRRLMKYVKERPKRQYRKGPARKEVAFATTQTVEDRGDSRLPGEAGGALGTPDLGRPLLCGEAPGGDSVPGGFCGYGELERMGQGEAAI